MIEAIDIRFGYRGASPLFDDFSLCCEPGELVAITGASGRGKSTMLWMLGLMLRPGAGEIVVDGAATSTATDGELARLRARSFGFVFQDAALDPRRSVLDNVTEPSLYRGEDPRRLRGRATRMLDELDVRVAPRARPGQVSGGQAQRIALCRALLGEPRIVLADEPTGNLDAQSANVVIERLESVAKDGSAVLIATHDPAVIARCSRMIAL